MTKCILIIDGDNFSGNYASALMAAACEFGEIAEACVFSTFREDKVTDKKNKPVPPKYTDKGWTAEILYKYAIVPHVVPILTAGTSATDMAIALHATERVFARTDIDVFIIATSDKDFMPLAMDLRNRGKRAIILHREGDCRTVIAFDGQRHVAKPLEEDDGKKPEKPAKPAQPEKPAKTAVRPAKQVAEKSAAEKSEERPEAAEQLAEILGRILKTPAKKCYLANLGAKAKDQFTALKKFTAKSQPCRAIAEVFARYPELFGKYMLSEDNTYIALK